MVNCRIFVEKKQPYQTEARALQNDFVENLHLPITHLRLINIYDIFNIENAVLEKAKYQVFAEKVTDTILDTLDLKNKKYIAVEYLPGQFDQRADSAMQCLSLIKPEQQATVKSGKLLLLEGDLSDDDLIKIKKYYINDIESREKNLTQLENIIYPLHTAPIQKFDYFNSLTKPEIDTFYENLNLAMTKEDLLHIQSYCQKEKPYITLTEIKMLDTYWSDHCRHTTFETVLENIKFGNNEIDKIVQNTYAEYLEMRKLLGRENRPITLMDMATINSHYAKKMGYLDNLEISEENNACSVQIDIDVNGETEKWLMMFKNETHNHPTEIEPFGGASTCIGGAIRDPLSGRSYVYQAMRITGAGDITQSIEKTLPNKLPQKNISREAALGYSSYGNQIGLATTHVREIYHPGYIAKRMEVGAVIGAVKAEWVKRATPVAGDIIILLGGRTGRDGIGGATGSSKAHNEQSLEICSAEVQKGNAPEERKLQRLFRNPEVTTRIKKANDFGAGGVSVAIGELAQGMNIYLDNIPVKYTGLNDTELAISESQERMGIVVAPQDAQTIISLAHAENIEATIIGEVTNTPQLVMYYKGQKTVDLNRHFINTNGVRQKANGNIAEIDTTLNPFVRSIVGKTEKEKILTNLSDLNVAIQKGMIEMFDATIGAGTVLMPFGGQYQLTETQASIQKFPIFNGETTTASIMTFGFNPYLSSWSPYHGAIYAVIESLTKIIASGGSYQQVRFSFQEYFERLNQNEYSWGKPIAALLGAIHILKAFNLAAIGGKDSMSGTFKDINVPPTLISFAVTTENTQHIVSPEFKKANHYIYLIKHQFDKHYMPSVDMLKKNFDFVHHQIVNKKIISAYSIGMGGICEALCKMCYGNRLGIQINTNENLFNLNYGSFIVEATEILSFENAILLGKVTTNDTIVINDITLSISEALHASINLFEPIYPTRAIENKTIDMAIVKTTHTKAQKRSQKTDIVKVVLPIFPGTNCEYDTAKAFAEAGAVCEFIVFQNIHPKDIEHSIKALSTAIEQSHILALSGGFSAGDEPDGSGKFIANILNHQKVALAIEKLLANEGLVLGICNGFQALIKSGLLPYGKTGLVTDSSPILVRNDINRHISLIAQTRVTSTRSPWLSSFHIGEQHHIAFSHGEGKFVITHEEAKSLFEHGQVAFQYCNEKGEATMDTLYNPNGSYYAIEGIISKCGRILGKMGHSERKGNHTFKNIHGNKNQDIFKNAIHYFKT